MELSKIAQDVIALSEAIQDYWDVELPKHHPDYPFVHPGEDSGPPPPEVATLQALLDGLPEETVYQLLLIMCLGRGDFGTEELAASHETLKETFGNRPLAVALMMDKPALADYLTEGLDELKKQGIDADLLTFTVANSTP